LFFIVMSRKISQPVGQMRLTNVVFVRLKKGGKKFEIAAYPNKVSSWRDQIETDLNEVLQARSIFTNVSKGILAKKDELKECFGTTDEDKILLQILSKGEVQVSEKEREVMMYKTFLDIATIVTEKCVDPETNRPLTVGLIERAMKELHFSVNSTKSAKQQALEVIKLLQKEGTIPIARAKMRLKLTMSSATESEKVLESLKDVIEIEKKGFKCGPICCGVSYTAR